MAGVAGRRTRARRGARRLWLALAIAVGAAFGGGVLAEFDQARTYRALTLAKSENRALRARQEALSERAVDLEGRLAGSVERVRRPPAGTYPGR